MELLYSVDSKDNIKYPGYFLCLLEICLIYAFIPTFKLWVIGNVAE